MHNFFRQFKRFLAISPHSDDIAYSCSGLLAQLDPNEASVKLLTCFSASSYLAVGEVSSVEEVMLVRKREDRAFVNTIGREIELKWFDFPDVPLRFNGARKMADRTVVEDDDAELVFQLASSLHQHDLEDTAVLVPLSFGCHIDHFLTHLGCLAALKSQPEKVIFYEDLPYAADISDADHTQFIRHVEKQFGAALSPIKVDITDTLEIKRKALNTYCSQLTEGLEETILGYAFNIGQTSPVERYWICSA